MVLTQINDVLKITHKNHPPRNLSRFDLDDWRFSSIITNPPIMQPADFTVEAVPRGVVEGEIYAPIETLYTYTVVDKDSGRESNPAGSKNATNDLFLRGFYNLLKIPKRNDVSGYRVYKFNQGAWGLIYSIDPETPANAEGSIEFKDTNFTPDMTRGFPKREDVFNASGKYPRANSVYQQRSVYGGPTEKGNKINLSQSGDFDNFYRSSPSQASDAIEFALASRQRQDVLWFVPVDDLIVFTGTGEWRVRGDDSNTLTAATIDARQQSAYGSSSDVQPLIIGQDIVFVQAKGQQVRNIAYDFGLNKYTGIDMSLLSRHLFVGRTIIQMAYAAVPFSTIYFVMSDGSVICCAYLKDQEVLGWSELTTNGIVESIAVVSEGQEDVPYFVVNRFVNGQSRRYIERMYTRSIVRSSDSFFVDSGLTYRGSPISHITGLSHLEGERIAVVGDGIPYRDLIVTGGSVDIPVAASRISAGLEYTSVLRTLDIDVAAPGLYGELRNVSKIIIHAEKTIGLEYGLPGGVKYTFKPDYRMDEFTQSGLFTGSFEASVEGDWNKGGRVEISTSLLPATILAVSPEFEAGGDTSEQDYSYRTAGRGR